MRRVSDLRHLCQTTSFSFIIKAGDLKEFPLNIEGGRYCVAQLYPKMGIHLFVIKVLPEMLATEGDGLGPGLLVNCE